MKTTTESAILTIAAIPKPRGETAPKFLFNERQRIFELRRGATHFREASNRLKEAFRKNLPIKAFLDGKKGVIERVESLAASEIDEVRRHRIPLERPQRIVPLDLEKIDPTTFNIVGRYLRPPIFRLCTKIVPNYKKAKEIFDFCAKQSCHLPGPKSISPCIPFQYVRDGCYARAHKMRWIITEKYNYCCEKVFSFGHPWPNVLAVQANKWGGCCVEWWYHVAPLIRVNVPFGRVNLVLAHVIDPGMFNQPVLLSTWLSAQENTSCNPNAKVTLYSIQPGSAYCPGWGAAGTSFNTDPTYSATDQTLTDYHSYTTC